MGRETRHLATGAQLRLRARFGAVRRWLAPRADLLIPGAAALLLASLSLNGLGRYSFWRDEVMSVLYASAPLGELLTIVGRDTEVADVPFMATYSVLLHAWLNVADTEAEIRLLSTLVAVAAVAPVYLIGRRLAGWPAGAMAALVFATAPAVISWSQEARSYSLAILTSASLTLLLLRATERPTVPRWLAYGVVAAVGLYVHLFIALIIAAHVAWLTVTRAWPPLRPLLAGLAPITVAALPLPYLALEYGSAYRWIPPLTFDQLRRTVVALAGGMPLGIGIVGLIVVAVVSHRRDRKVFLLLAALLTPFVVAVLVSTFRPMLLSRYLVVSLPAMAVLAGLGLSALRPAALRAGAAVVLAVLIVLALPSAYADNRQQDWRGAGSWIGELARPGDGIVVTSWGRPHLDYYLRRTGASPLPERTTIRAALADESPARLWVVLTATSDANREAALERLNVRYTVEEERHFGARVVVVRMTSR